MNANGETQMTPAEAGLLAEMVQYQDDSVVSRTLVQRDTGTVTLFAFDAGQGLSEHSAPFDALVYIVDGTCEITISGHSHQLRRGATILMPADEPHAVAAIEPFKMLLIMIRS